MPLLPSITSNNNHTNALIVGATQGIGLEFVRQLRQESHIANIFATYRSERTASELRALATQHPHRLHCVPMDITEEETIISSMQTLKDILAEQDRADSPQSHPALHIVINCVGLLHNEQQQPEKALRQLNTENLVNYFKVNSIGPALLAKHLMPLLKHKSPSIFATISAKVGSIGDNRLGGWYGYRASKAALNMFLKTAAIEYSRRTPNTTLIILHPGTTNTQLSKPFQRGVSPEKLFSTERTVSQLLTVLSNVTPEDSGEFFSWDGSRLPW
ncbi:MAG: SDR family NAD(P)-dependent oxidoreductase [Cyanobacteria bacterium P01_F01_bin.53]